MTIYSSFSVLYQGEQRNRDLSVNTLSVAGLQVGAATTQILFDTTLLSANRTLTFPDANIDFRTMMTNVLADGYLWIGNSSNVATAVLPSGDVTISDAGVTAIGSGKVTSGMLAGSIADSKLSTITTANKVAGSAVQLASGGGLQNSSGLLVKVSDFAGSGLSDNGSNALKVNVDNSTLSIVTNTLQVNSIANAQIGSGAAIAYNKLAALTASLALVSDSSGYVTTSATTTTELGYVHGVTSNIQTQLNGKAALVGADFTGVVDMGTHKITSLATGTNPNDAVNLAQMQLAVSTGNTFKEAILSAVQLSSSQGILPAAVIDIVTNPVIGDTIILKSAASTETWTFAATRTGAFTVAIGGTVLVTMENLSAAIALDSSGETGYFDSSLLVLNNVGEVLVMDKTTTTLPSTTRIYGVWGTQASCRIVPFNGATQYTIAAASVTLPAVDPGTTQFGFGRTVVDLTDGEVHAALDNNSQWAWNGSLVAWVQISGAGSVANATSGIGGGIKGISTFDSSKGLTVASGVVSVETDASTIGFNLSGQLEVLTGGISATQIANNAVGTTQLGNIVSSGLAGSNGSAISVQANGTSIAVGGSGVSVNYDNTTIGLISSHLAVLNASIDENKLTTSVAGDGLLGGNGTKLHVVADTTGGLNLATAINISSNGVAVKVDGTSIGANISSQLEVIPGGVDHSQLYNLNSSSYTHLSSTNAGLLTGGANTTLHYHSSDRNRANATGTQLAATISDFASAVETDVAALFAAGTDTGISITHSSGLFNATVLTDGATVGINGSNKVYVLSSGITATQLASSCFSDGLVGGAGTFVKVQAAANKAISVGAAGVAVNYDNSTVGINLSNQLYIPNGGVTATQINSSALSSGLQGGSGTAISVEADSTTSNANIAKSINVSSNGVAVKVDGSTIAGNASNQLGVPNAGITETQIASSSLLSTGGLQGGSSTKLSVKLADTTLSTTSNGIGVNSAPAVTIPFVTAVTLSANHTYALRMSVAGETAGSLYLADNNAASTTNYYVLGTYATGSSSVSPGSTINIVMAGVVACASDTNFSTIGIPVFLGSSGALTTTAPSSTSTAVVRLGIVSATGSGTSSFVMTGAQVVGIN
jgi:hypothetical protein